MSDSLHDTVIGDELRVAIAVAGVAATIILIALWARRKRAHDMGFAESMSVLGGALVCASVTVASVGLVLDWDSVWRLPLLLVALSYVVIGRGLELWRLRKRRR